MFCIKFWFPPEALRKSKEVTKTKVVFGGINFEKNMNYFKKA